MGIETLLELIKDYAPKDKETIIRAYEFASNVHKDAKRKSGEPYIVHPIAVACISAAMHADVDTIVADLLHDVVEDGINITLEQISEYFNPTVARLVDGVTKLPKLSVNNDKRLTDEANTRKISESIIFDIRTILMKLADRLHNMRTLQYHKREKQIEISKETLEFYVPFADLIGAYTIKLELEDLCLKYLDPEKYQEMEQLSNQIYIESFNEIQSAIVRISQLLNSSNIPFEFKFKRKNYYGLAKSLKSSELADIHDLFALKFILKDVNTCYWLREQIHSLYPYFSDYEKDYIAKPKDNMYRSLHSTVNAGKTKLQFQLKTEEMYKINSYGLTAYWDLLKFNHAPEHMQEDVSKMPFFKTLCELVNNNLANDEFNQEVKKEILSPKIKVLTPVNEEIYLPEGATPVDFAYKISTDIGNNIVHAFVNGKPVALDYQLQNDDQIYIEHNPDFIGPRVDTYPMCQTPRAKRRIREYRKNSYK